ncbi:MAG TPA: spermidine synthase [Geobacteraceae bacterium]|nr:spermidine synthase [Geobacteraceae bacterium]
MKKDGSVYLYAFTIFLSAFLLFQIQPMIARMILPWFGGSAAVWITAMLFFQTALLVGYLYAHWSVRSLRPGTQAAVHVIILLAALFFLPVGPSAAWKPTGGEEPITRILGLLACSVGLPYFLLSTTSPLIQAWYGRRFRSALPYRLFALSNLASLLGLLAYPFFIEPYITLRQQSIVWSAAYALFMVFCIMAAVKSRQDTASVQVQDVGATETDEASSRAPKLSELLLWILLACCASTMLLSVTNHLTQNVASIPFLWIIPLSLYLLTFILTFDCERIYNRKLFAWLLAITFGVMTYVLWNWTSRVDIRLSVAVYSAGLFICCMFCHGELVKRKPAPGHLTLFYLMLSAGGALGGIIVGLAGPIFLNGYFELPAALIACAVLSLITAEFRPRPATAVLALAAVCLTVSGVRYINSFGYSCLAMSRNFYGSLRVMEYDKDTEDEARALIHGTVIHGKQFTDLDRRREHITYYGPRSGISLALQSLRHSPLKVGVIGLGAGSLASFAEPGDVFRFYEINPQVEKLARSEFTYLSDCRGKVEVVIGDGRLALEREPSQQFDLLVADAFSGDAIPVHLIDLQAIQLYFRHLKPYGILALNITNTHLNVAPVVDRLARALGKYAVSVVNGDDEDREIYFASWALVSSRPIRSSLITKVATPLESRPELRTWTDDYSNLFQILK